MTKTKKEKNLRKLKNPMQKTSGETSYSFLFSFILTIS